LNEKSELGLMLKALIGYNGNPSLTEAISYVSYLAGISTYVSTRKQNFPAMAPSAAS